MDSRASSHNIGCDCQAATIRLRYKETATNPDPRHSRCRHLVLLHPLYAGRCQAQRLPQSQRHQVVLYQSRHFSDIPIAQIIPAHSPRLLPVRQNQYIDVSTKSPPHQQKLPVRPKRQRCRAMLFLAPPPVSTSILDSRYNRQNRRHPATVLRCPPAQPANPG